MGVCCVDIGSLAWILSEALLLLAGIPVPSEILWAALLFVLGNIASGFFSEPGAGLYQWARSMVLRVMGRDPSTHNISSSEESSLPVVTVVLYPSAHMRPDSDQTMTVGRQVSVREAAEILGITVEAVRSRIKRSTLRHSKGSDGRVYVLLDGDQTRPDGDRFGDQEYKSSYEQTVLVAQLRDEVTFLRKELERKDAILLRFVENVPELTSGPPSECRHASKETGIFVVGEDDVTAGGELHSDSSVSKRRSWWRRLLLGSQ